MKGPQARSAIEVRRAAVADAARIAAVLRQAFGEYEALYTPAAFAATTPTARQIQGRWDEGPVWVALVEGRVMGTAAGVPWGGGLYLRSMGVLPAARGQGLGRRLLEAIEGFAREQGIRRMFLSTTPFLLPAIRLYERSGFEQSADGPHDLHGTPLFTMVKRLRPISE